MAVSLNLLDTKIRQEVILFCDLNSKYRPDMKVCEKGTFFSIKGLPKGYCTFSFKMVFKSEQGWTSGQSLPVKNFVEYLLWLITHDG